MFKLPKRRVLQTLPKILTYLHSIGTRLRHPTDWGQVTFQNITCPTGPFVLAYMLYLSCATIRRNATQGSVAMFKSSHAAIFAALEQNMCMCGMVVPALVTGLLEESVRVEVGLARYGGLFVVVAGSEMLRLDAKALRLSGVFVNWTNMLIRLSCTELQPLRMD
jgi:hypothetical protein